MRSTNLSLLSIYFDLLLMIFFDRNRPFTFLDQVEEINPDKEVADLPLPEVKGKVKAIRESLHFTNIVRIY